LQLLYHDILNRYLPSVYEQNKRWYIYAKYVPNVFTHVCSVPILISFTNE